MFDSAYHFRSFPSASSSTHSWPQRTRLAHISSFPVLGFFLCYYQRVVVPPCAPYQLQPNSCIYQDSAQAQPRQHICGCGKKKSIKVPLVLAKVDSHPWKVLITAIPSSCMGSPSKEAAGPSFSGTKSSVTAWFSVVVPGLTHPIVEVRHDARRASLRRVLECLSEPPCETIQCLGTGCSAARVLPLLEASTPQSR